MLRHPLFCLLLGLFVTALTAPSQAANEAAQKVNAPSGTPAVVVAPAPAGETLSDDFQLTVGGQPVPVYRCRVSAVPFNQPWPGYQRPLDQTELASFASWDMAAAVEIEVVSHRPIESVAIHPLARQIQPQVTGNRIRFQLASPQQITVEVNGLHQALHLFANPPAAAAPDPQAPGVRYFGPGVHRPGKIVLQSNETLYLADGAVVYGRIEAQDASKLRILGRGIFDSSEFPRGAEEGCIRLRNCHDVEIDGVILRDPPAWCLSTFRCSDLKITNLKLIGLWRYNSDGIDLCDSHDAVVRNCFVRSFDDSLVIKGLNPADDTTPIHDILFEGCVVWNDWGRALELGAETRSPEFRNVTFRDCDVIHPSFIALDAQHCDRAAIQNVLFEDIRVEIDEVNRALQMQTSREEKFVEDTKFCPKFLVLQIVKSGNSVDAARGTIDQVTVRNCTVTGKPRPASDIYGFDATHRVQNVLISNLRFNGQPAKSLDEAKIKVGPYADAVRLQAE